MFRKSTLKIVKGINDFFIVDNQQNKLKITPKEAFQLQKLIQSNKLKSIQDVEILCGSIRLKDGKDDQEG